MAPPVEHPEWALVRCLQKNAAEPYFTENWRAPGAVGLQSDRARCLFCGATFAGKVEYVRAHVGGVSNVGVAVCKGVTRRDDEGDAALAERVAEHTRGKALMLAKVASLAAAKTAAAEKQKRADATSGAPQSKKARPSVFTWLDKPSDAEQQRQTAADEALSFAFMSASGVGAARCIACTLTPASCSAAAGIAPNVLDNAEVKAALAKVALVGQKYKVPSRRTVGGSLAAAHRKRVGALIAAKAAVCKLGGYSITSDGAQNKKNQPVVCVVKVQGGLAEFISCVDATGITKDAEWTANHICSVIEAQPVPQDCVAVHL